MYKEALGLHNTSDIIPHSSPQADRILLTRILSPAFEDCDVHFPDFREQKREDGDDKWIKTSHARLVEWVGSEVLEGVQEEKGVRYEFQMWTCRT